MLNSVVRRSGLLVAAAALVAAGCKSSDNTSNAPNTLPPPPIPTATPVWGQVTVSWTGGGGADSTNIYWSTTAGVTPATGTKIHHAKNPTVLTGLTNGTTYYYVLTGLNANGEGSPSTEVSAKPLATMVPATPTHPSASPGTSVDTLAWTAVAGATSYNIYWATATGIDVTDPTTYTKINNPTASYIHSVLANGTPYFYVITAQNANGESAPTHELTATPQVALAAPTGLSARPGDTRDTLFWHKLSGATGYRVYRGTATGVTTTTGTQLSATDTTLIDTLRTNGTQYFYVATSLKGAVESSISGEVNATPQARPAAPTGVSAAVGNTQDVITWTAGTGSTTSNIYFSTSAGVTAKNGTKIAGVSSPYTHTGRTNGTTYYYVVTGDLGGVQSALSSEVNVTPNVTPVAPTGLAGAPAGASDTLTWNTVGNAATYNLYFGTATGVTTATGTKIAGVAPGFVHTGRTNGTTYYYIVTAVNSAGESPASAEANVTPAAQLAAPVVTGALGNAQATLTWAAVTGATSYNVYRDGVLLGAGVSPYVDGGRTNGTAYTYNVTAVKSNVSSPLSKDVVVTPLAPPTGVTATAGTTAGHITVGWTAAFGATGSNIYYSGTAGVTIGGTGVTKIGGAANPYDLGGLTTGNTYYFVVTFTNASGETAISAEHSVAAP